MNEAKFTSRLIKWLNYTNILGTCAIEVKLTKGKSIPFNAVVDHQKMALHNTKNDSLTWKIPDVGYQNPYDIYRMVEEEAYVVLAYYTKGKKEIPFFVIPIDTWVRLENTHTKKSLTIEDCRKYVKDKKYHVFEFNL